MAEWMVATDRNQLATSADFATKALELRYGSLQAAIQRLGTMENLRPYAVEIKTCITTAGTRPAEMTADGWRLVLDKQQVNQIGAACVVLLGDAAGPRGSKVIE